MHQAMGLNLWTKITQCTQTWGGGSLFCYWLFATFSQRFGIFAIYETPCFPSRLVEGAVQFIPLHLRPIYLLRIQWPVYIHTCTFSVNTKRYWFPCQNTWVLWDCYLYKQWHCEQNTVSFNTRECICKYGIEFINILLFADKGLNFKHLSSSQSCPTKSLGTSFWTACPQSPSLCSPAKVTSRNWVSSWRGLLGGKTSRAFLLRP